MRSHANPSRRRTAAVLLTLVIPLAAACGEASSESDDTSPSTVDTGSAPTAVIEDLIADGLAAFEAGDLAAAEAAFAQAVDQEPSNTVALFDLGSTLVSAGKNEEAIEVLDRLLEIEPENVDGLFNRGVAEAQSGDTDGAVADLQTVIDLDPEYARAYFQLGNLYIALGQVDKGMDLVDRAVELDPALGASAEP